jgi:putative redox protein
MGAMKPPLTLELVWERDLVFGGRSGHTLMTLDSAGVAGPSPVQALAFALAGCMGMDVVHILQKGRYDLRGLGVALSAERAQDNPHRVTAVDMRFLVTGAVPDAQVQRAIDLSREKYCSVWHSLRQDIPLKTSFTITGTGP